MTIKCAVCGREQQAGNMIQRRLNGRSHFCCGISCEVQWEKQNLLGVCG